MMGRHTFASTAGALTILDDGTITPADRDSGPVTIPTVAGVVAAAGQALDDVKRREQQALAAYSAAQTEVAKARVRYAVACGGLLRLMANVQGGSPTWRVPRTLLKIVHAEGTGE